MQKYNYSECLLQRQEGDIVQATLGVIDMTKRTLKVSDRVKRAGGQGCVGVVKELRDEVMASKVESPENGLLVNVLWDNGTLSYLSPDALELVEG